MRKSLPLLAALALALAACEPAPNYTAGVGFDDYSAIDAGRAQREAELRGTGATTVPLPPGSGGPISESALAAAGLPTAGGGFAASGGTLPAATGPMAPGAVASEPLSVLGSPVPPGTPLPDVGGSHPRISNEQSFEAVSSRETIASDAARLAAQAQAYEIIPPQPLPPRPDESAPNVVAYALQTQNRVGEQVYSRSGINLAFGGPTCASYSSPDKAQEAFLAAGGPQRDRHGLDPDGDGFACAWDPAPFRTVRAN